jgi:hypothetical protein
MIVSEQFIRCRYRKREGGSLGQRLDAARHSQIGSTVVSFTHFSAKLELTEPTPGM